MAKFAVMRRQGGLLPCNPEALSEIEKLPEGVRLKADVVRERSGPFHRWYWQLCTLIADTLNAGPGDITWTQESVSDALKIGTGRVHIVDLSPPMARRYGTKVAVKPASISFAKMDQTEFATFVEAAVAYILTEFGDWIIRDERWAEVREILRLSREGDAA